MDVYNDARQALSKEPIPPPTGGRGSSGSTLVAISCDPEKTWREVAPQCLHEMNAYAEWVQGTAVKTFQKVGDISELHELGLYLVLTPQECVEHAAAQDNRIVIHPLLGGIAPKIAWESLKLIQSQVLPRLAGAQVQAR